MGSIFGILEGHYITWQTTYTYVCAWELSSFQRRCRILVFQQLFILVILLDLFVVFTLRLIFVICKKQVKRIINCQGIGSWLNQTQNSSSFTINAGEKQSFTQEFCKFEKTKSILFLQLNNKQLVGRLGKWQSHFQRT